MSRVVPTQRFVDDLAEVWSERVERNIAQAVDAIAMFPRIGSSQLTPSISAEFGEDVMKVAVRPFDLIYEYDEAHDTVYLYGLVPMRSVH